MRRPLQPGELRKVWKLGSVVLDRDGDVWTWERWDGDLIWGCTRASSTFDTLVELNAEFGPMEIEDE